MRRGPVDSGGRWGARTGALRISVGTLLVVAAACDSGERPALGEVDVPIPAPVSNPPDRLYERSIVFSTVGTDTAFMVPMLFTAETHADGIARTARGWLRRGSTWDAFHDASWDTPPSRAPWRLLPHGGLRLVVGVEDAITTIVFEEGPRVLELEFGNVLIEWTGRTGQVFRLLDGALFLSEQRVGGIVVDATRTLASSGPPGGDWAFLMSGDSLQVVLESTRYEPPGTPGVYHGWGRLDSRELQWPSLTVEWPETSAFEPARQDVPAEWSIVGGQDLVGTLTAETAQLQAGDGPGPLLPVDGLFGVSGTLVIDGQAFPVRGLIRHTRP